MRIKREGTVVVGIDYQEKLIPSLYNKEILVENSVKLLAGMQVLGVPIYFTQQYTKGLGSTIEEICEAAGTNEYLEKIRFSGYQELKTKLLGPVVQPYVILCGVESHVCVLQTALELKEHGYQPILAANCITSRKRKDYEMALERAKQENIILTTYEAILFELLEEAGNETCKSIQRIVK